ncbi:anthocyanidin-3-O-glucoside rhamnosyltransferase-like [Lolium rigidum]|uniref:anthocyanidin-3-O-glucoside rhamnosyltransferase-like n=1 Tax=Lolium rigidum TaxID=89674 RepID=UPI001F5CBB58|nr:anthocyanidin-3-O-glucoside rhamnosyltransferase-like [Lolium rigidum]
MSSGTETGGDVDGMHVVMFPFLAVGHITPFVQLARKLIAADGGVRVTLLSAAANVPRVQAMLGLSAVAVVQLRLPRVPGLPDGAESTADVSMDGAELLKVAIDGTRPQVAALLAELRPDAILFDFATPWVPEVAAPLGVKTLMFSTFSALSGAYLMVPARRNASAKDLESAPSGFPPSSSLATVPTYQAADFSYVFRSFHGKPSVYERFVAGVQASDGLVLRTCAEMEGPYISYLAAQLGKPVLATGPVVPEAPEGELEERWAQWLSSFPDKAVVYVAFGSEAYLTAAAITELLLGLESSNRPFLAVLNFPMGTDVEGCTPPGFAERTKGRGVVHTGWVQQRHILQHRSVGCFVTHAGLSSLVEGLVAGCPLVLLPNRGDQFLNTALFARELRVGVEVARRDGDGWFGRGDISAAIDTAMADGWDGEGSKWKEFMMDDAVQKRFAHDFVRDFTKSVRA